MREVFDLPCFSSRKSDKSTVICMKIDIRALNFSFSRALGGVQTAQMQHLRISRGF